MRLTLTDAEHRPSESRSAPSAAGSPPDRSRVAGKLVAALILAVVLAAAVAVWWRMRAEGRARRPAGASDAGAVMELRLGGHRPAPPYSG